MKLQLYDYQQKGVNDIRAALRHNQAVLYVLPTAGGKTVIFTYICERAAAKGNKVMILVHRRELLNQASRKLWDLGVEHGQIASGKSMSALPVQVASVDTLVRRLDNVIEPDIIISDECHHDVANSRRKIYSRFSRAKVIGFTATAERLDGKGLGRGAGGFYDTLITGPYIDELIDIGRIPPFAYFAPKRAFSLDGVPTGANGDYRTAYIEERVDKRQIIGNAVDKYAKHCPGMPAIAFGVSVRNAQHIADQFNGVGIAAESIDGNLSPAERDKRIQMLTDGRILVLTSCDIISEGTDIPIVGAAILLRPTQSLALYLQQVGRACRMYPGKEHTYILDHAGLLGDFGPPWFRRQWSLEGRKKCKGSGEAFVAVTQCPECYGVYKPTTRVCPYCGFIRPIIDREVEEVDGELYRYQEQLRIQDEQARQAVLRDEEKRDKKREAWQKRREVAKAQTYGELLAIGQERGYRDAGRWARIIMASREAKRERVAS